MNKAERVARSIPVIVWRFSAYKSEEEYDKGEPYFTKDFLNFNKMKDYSSAHSYLEKDKYPEYCSMYWKIEFIPK